MFMFLLCCVVVCLSKIDVLLISLRILLFFVFQTWYALSHVLHAFDKILICLYVWGFSYQSICTYTHNRRQWRKAIAPWKWGTPYCSLFLLFFYDGRKPKANIAEILKFQSFENFQNMRKGQKCICWNIHLRVNMKEKVIAHNKKVHSLYVPCILIFSWPLPKYRNI